MGNPQDQDQWGVVSQTPMDPATAINHSAQSQVPAPAVAAQAQAPAPAPAAAPAAKPAVPASNDPWSVVSQTPMDAATATAKKAQAQQETPPPSTSAWQRFKSRMMEPVKQEEIERIPGLEPSRVAALQEQGQDTLAATTVGDVVNMLGPGARMVNDALNMAGVHLDQHFGKERADYIRDKILHGYTPEVAARAAAKTLTDWYSPAMLALSVPGRIAHGYSAAAEAAEKIGLTQKASLLADKARLAGVIGTASGVPFVASQVHSLIDNWHDMTPAERTSAMAGILGGSMMTGVSLHEGGAAAIKDQAQKTGSAIADTAGNVAENVRRAVGAGNDLEKLVTDTSKPSKGKAQEYNASVKAALPQLKEVFKNNPNISTPEEAVNAIQQHIDNIEDGLREKARGLQDVNGQPAEKSILAGAEDTLREELGKYFKEHEGAYKQPQVDAAIEEAVNRLRQGGGEEPRDPSLFEGENLRRQLNKETAPAFGVDATPNAARDAKIVTAAVLRNMIDAKYDELGVKDVQEWRKQEAPLIDVKDQLVKAFQKSKDMGEWSLINAATKSAGWGLIGSLIGHFPGGIAGESLGIAKDYIKDRLTNPNRLIQRAVKVAGKEPGATGAVLPNNSPFSSNIPPAPTGPTIKPPTAPTGPIVTHPPAAPKGGGTSAAFLPEEAPRVNPEQEMASHDSEIARLQAIVDNPNAPENEKAYATQAIKATREMRDQLANTVPAGAKETEQASKAVTGGGKTPREIVEGAGGVFRGINGDGSIEITVPEALTKDLNISEPLKKFVSATIPADTKLTPEVVKEAINRKLVEFGGKPVAESEATPKEAAKETPKAETPKTENTPVVPKMTAPAKTPTVQPAKKSSKLATIAKTAAVLAAGGLGVLAGTKGEKEEKEPDQSGYEVISAPKEAETKADVPNLLEKYAGVNNIPLGILQAQAKQESGGNEAAVSPKGAAGVLQLMPKTAESLGVDPTDTEQNISGGSAYLSELHKRFGKWDQALAAYNWGPDRVQKVIDNYGDEWLYHTPDETQEYVHKILKQHAKNTTSEKSITDISGQKVPGLVSSGNIDVNHRPVIWNDDGSPSTIFSATIPIGDGKWALVPTIANGRFLTPNGKIPKESDKKAMQALEDAATEQYEKSGEHLGIFNSQKSADDYAEKTHAWMPDGSSQKIYTPYYEGESNMPLSREEYETELSRRQK